MLEQYISNDYLRATIILFLVFIGVKIIIFIIEKYIKKITAKTKTELDDKLIESTSKPITAIAFLFGLRIAIEEIPLTIEVGDLASKIIYSIIIVFVGLLVYGVLNSLFFVSWKKFTAKTKTDLDDSLANLVHGLLKAVLIIMVLIYILDLWNIQIGPFLAGLGIGGIAIAFALQSSLGNIFGGVSLIMDKSIRVGDMVSLDGGVSGIVEHVGIRSTRVKTFDNDTIILPNGKLAESRIQNLNQPDPKQRVTVPFSVAYGSDIDRVKKIVLAEIKKIPNLVNKPSEPSVRFLEMGSSSLNFKAFFYVDSFMNRFSSLDEANTRIYNALRKNKIEIPFPQMDVYLKK